MHQNAISSLKKNIFLSGRGIAPSPGGKAFSLSTLHPYQAFWIHPASPQNSSHIYATASTIAEFLVMSASTILFLATWTIWDSLQWMFTSVINALSPLGGPSKISIRSALTRLLDSNSTTESSADTTLLLHFFRLSWKHENLLRGAMDYDL